MSHNNDNNINLLVSSFLLLALDTPISMFAYTIKHYMRFSIKTCVFLLIVAQLIYQLIFYSPFSALFGTKSTRSVRIYCMILTSPKYFETRARAVNLTWAPRCDKYHFISEESDTEIDLPIAPIAGLKAGYNQLTLKTSLALVYAYKHFRNDFDWFVKADDDTYLLVENLRKFLQTHDSREPVTFGYNFKVNFHFFLSFVRHMNDPIH
jgi:hypothetical protein